MQRLLTIALGVAFTLGAVYPAFAADEPPPSKADAKKKKKSAMDEKTGLPISPPATPSVPTVFNISGSVTGVEQGPALTLRVTGPATRSVAIRESGPWSVAGLPPGTYTVSLTSAAYNVTPASRQVVVQGSNVGNTDFAVKKKVAPPKPSKVKPV